MSMKIVYTPRFVRAYKKLTDEIKDKAELKEQIFRKDPFASSLWTHKLTGNFVGFWFFFQLIIVIELYLSLEKTASSIFTKSVIMISMNN